MKEYPFYRDIFTQTKEQNGRVELCLFYISFDLHNRATKTTLNGQNIHSSTISGCLLLSGEKTPFKTLHRSKDINLVNECCLFWKENTPLNLRNAS